MSGRIGWPYGVTESSTCRPSRQGPITRNDPVRQIADHLKQLPAIGIVEIARLGDERCDTLVALSHRFTQPSQVVPDSEIDEEVARRVAHRAGLEKTGGQRREIVEGREALDDALAIDLADTRG